MAKKNFSRKDNRQNNKKVAIYYSFFTIVLIFCLIQIGYGAILNISKIFSYKGKENTLENLLHQAQAKNKDLKNEKKVVTSDNSLEGIARNNLKMAGEDEVLIIINKKVEEPAKPKKFSKFEEFFNLKFKKNPDVKPKEPLYIPSEVVEE